MAVLYSQRAKKGGGVLGDAKKSIYIDIEDMNFAKVNLIQKALPGSRKLSLDQLIDDSHPAFDILITWNKLAQYNEDASVSDQLRQLLEVESYVKRIKSLLKQRDPTVFSITDMVLPSEAWFTALDIVNNIRETKIDDKALEDKKEVIKQATQTAIKESIFLARERRRLAFLEHNRPEIDSARRLYLMFSCTDGHDFIVDYDYVLDFLVHYDEFHVSRAANYARNIDRQPALRRNVLLKWIDLLKSKKPDAISAFHELCTQLDEEVRAAEQVHQTAKRETMYPFALPSFMNFEKYETAGIVTTSNQYWTYNTDATHLRLIPRVKEYLIKNILYLVHSDTTTYIVENNLQAVPISFVGLTIKEMIQKIVDIHNGPDRSMLSAEHSITVAAINRQLAHTGDTTMVDGKSLYPPNDYLQQILREDVAREAKIAYLMHQYSDDVNTWLIPNWEVDTEGTVGVLRRKFAAAFFNVALCSMKTPALSVLFGLGRKEFTSRLYLPEQITSFPFMSEVTPADCLPHDIIIKMLVVHQEEIDEDDIPINLEESFARPASERKEPPTIEHPIEHDLEQSAEHEHETPIEIEQTAPVTAHIPRFPGIDPARITAAENDSYFLSDFDGEPIIMPDNVGRRLYPEDPIVANKTTSLMATRLGIKNTSPSAQRAEVAQYMGVSSADLYRKYPEWINKAKQEHLISVVDF